jgi:hypothetical protein
VMASPVQAQIPAFQDRPPPPHPQLCNLQSRKLGRCIQWSRCLSLTLLSRCRFRDLLQ